MAGETLGGLFRIGLISLLLLELASSTLSGMPVLRGYDDAWERNEMLATGDRDVTMFRCS
jgi:hypothetical protein